MHGLLWSLVARDGEGDLDADTGGLNGTSASDLDFEDVHGGSSNGTGGAVAFIIGLSIVLFASLLNAGGLNLTKLDHVRTSAVPKASRKKDWLRPLWLLGMMLYILSQLIGSTLALRYMRAEYVAPLGATSLIFNFMFASLLVGTPISSTDIYGTIIVILGVVGIVAFGSINSGLENGMDADLLHRLWSRLNWILLFVFMSLALFILYIFASQLDRVLAARADISSIPFAGQAQRRSQTDLSKVSVWKKIGARWDNAMGWTAEKLEGWTGAKEDKTLAWTLGIVWACCGGGLAGGCLVFARATVQLLSYASTLDHPSSQFASFASIITIVFLALTAIFQILCLNRALRVYDSTLVVPVFYGVYTGTGFLDALVFNNEVDQYRTWTLCLIVLSILVLVSGVVLLTHKKPEPGASDGSRTGGNLALGSIPASRKRNPMNSKKTDEDSGEAGEEHEHEALHPGADPDPVVWELGNADEDDEDDETLQGDAHGSKDGHGQHEGTKKGLAGSTPGEEGKGLMKKDDDEDW